MTYSFGPKIGLVVLFLGLAACGNGGQINFTPRSVVTKVSRGSDYNMVIASETLAIESGKTTTNGYHAKLQLNNQSGTYLTNGAYGLKLKYTVRNR